MSWPPASRAMAANCCRASTSCPGEAWPPRTLAKTALDSRTTMPTCGPGFLPRSSEVLAAVAARCPTASVEASRRGGNGGGPCHVVRGEHLDGQAQSCQHRCR
eukprot:CAMPEP_0175458134 /NCGR_PEP_ID=MMETSP0095-20121207/66428_1 /TAXON_ID=311494 /ORGANISM="Alexandrium monilatum, Strain CCMP3105" /LENGTH=102 /DNA_ID=CAMNT_0016759027 /DNA_START=208 /DNA_END=512 /DNA_ORIENTATION=+